LVNKVTVKVIDKDRGWKNIKTQLLFLVDGRTVVIGIQGDDANEAREGGMTNIKLGNIHEYGTDDGKIPARSFLRSTFDANNRKYLKAINRISKNIFGGVNPLGQLMLLGEVARADVLKTIKSKIPPPLAESTIAHKKGETTPLIDTGQLFNSISSVIVDLNEARSR